MATNSPINLQLPQQPRLPVEGNAAIYSEFQSVYNAIRNLWQALGSASLIDDAPSDGNIYGRQNGAWVIASGGGGSVTWGSITGNINDQTDLIAKFTTVNNNITAINVELADLWTALASTNANVLSLQTRMTAAEDKNTEQDGRLTAIEAVNTAQDAAIAAKIGDAPTDGQEYVRKDGAWVVASASTGGGVYMPMVTGDKPPVFIYDEDGGLIYARVA